jgi:hypothetical protein
MSFRRHFALGTDIHDDSIGRHRAMAIGRKVNSCARLRAIMT